MTPLHNHISTFFLLGETHQLVCLIQHQHLINGARITNSLHQTELPDRLILQVLYCLHTTHWKDVAPETTVGLEGVGISESDKFQEVDLEDVALSG